MRKLYAALFITSLLSGTIAQASQLAPAEVPDASVAPNPMLLQAPQYVPLEQSKLNAALENAHKGDSVAQDLVVQNNYWGFLNMDNPVNNFGFIIPNQCHQESPLTWSNIEERAIQDHQYAYTLINACASRANRGMAPVSFFENYPKLFQILKINADEGDSNAQFNLGVLYQQFSRWPRQLGLDLQTHTINELALQLFRKSANQRNYHAQIALGMMHYKARDFVAALPWFLAARNSKTGEIYLRDVLPGGSCPQVEGSFLEEVEAIEFQLNQLVGSHTTKIGLHNPQGSFSEHKCVIPQLTKLYQKVLTVEDEACKRLVSLKHTTPGFLLSSYMFSRVNIQQLKELVSKQSEPHLVAVDTINKAPHLTIGVKNVAIKSAFLAYVNQIDEIFSKAEKALKKIKEYYRLGLDSAVGELMTKRLVALKNNDEASLQAFEAQKTYVDEVTLILKPHLKEIKQEIVVLLAVKDAFKTLLVDTDANRNFEFKEYLKPTK
jgi:tetratricopeptide (TPR) repeat protein